jgi:5'-3' exonuclease
MGVKGLFQFLKRFEKTVHIPYCVSSKSIGIDIFWFIHQSKGDMFDFQNSLLPYIKYAKEIHCVFDGAPSKEKKQQLDEATQKRKEILQSIEQIEKFLKYPFNQISNPDRHLISDYLHQLKRQIWQPSPQYIQEIKNWLIKKDCEVYQALGEADNMLINLENEGVIQMIVTNDSDLLTLGSKQVLRPITPLKGALFDTKYICVIIGFTVQQWNDFMYLCKNMKENDILLAYSLISVYKELDYVLQKYNNIYQDDLIVDT